MLPKGTGMPSQSPHPMGLSPEEYARRRLMLAQRAGLFRGPIPQGNLAATWRNFSTNLSSDAAQHGYQDPNQWMHDSAREGQPVMGPRFLGGAIQQQGAGFAGGGGGPNFLGQPIAPGGPNAGGAYVNNAMAPGFQGGPMHQPDPRGFGPGGAGDVLRGNPSWGPGTPPDMSAQVNQQAQNYPPAVQGLMNAENPLIKQMLAQALAAMQRGGRPTGLAQY